MLLASSFALIALAVVVLLAFTTGVLDAVTMRAMITSLRQTGSHLIAFLRAGFRTLRTLTRRSAKNPCDCLACHHFRDTTLSTATRHKLLPLKVGKVVDELINDVQDFLAEQETSERD